MIVISTFLLGKSEAFREARDLMNDDDSLAAS
jgi:hypothetical protein